MKPPSAFSSPNPSLRARPRPDRQVQTFHPDQTRPAGDRVKKKPSPSPCPNPSWGPQAGGGHTLGTATCGHRATHTETEARFQAEPALAPRRNQAAPGPPGKSGGSLARDVSHEPRSGPAPPAQPRQPLPARVAAPRGARPAVSPPTCCQPVTAAARPACPQGENPTPAASQQLHFLNERLMRGVNQWPLPPGRQGRAVGRSPCTELVAVPLVPT